MKAIFIFLVNEKFRWLGHYEYDRFFPFYGNKDILWDTNSNNLLLRAAVTDRNATDDVQFLWPGEEL